MTNPELRRQVINIYKGMSVVMAEDWTNTLDRVGS